MNQLGEKPEEVRKQLEEEKRRAREEERKSAEGTSGPGERPERPADEARADDRDQG
ncbi:hypothetical protein [Streptomyces albidochromogenes]|uniref:Uncharacterized protein n=1 Tax=Streptomyces albidochromogenes TaxID=329524 RepID=A0ABW6FU12_9ACTN